MTADELIKHLQTVPGDTPVALRGHIGGTFVPVTEDVVRLGRLMTHKEDETFTVSINNRVFKAEGGHNFKAPFDCVIIGA